MKIEDKAPDFCLKDAQGKEHCLRDYNGRKVVVYFYPRDNTPGCTIEAIDFSNLIKEFEKENTIILGISKDSIESHQKFIDSKKLSIILLSDEDSKVQKDYGIWRKKKFLGKEFIGTVRSTFLINEKQKVLKIWDPVSVKGHALDVLKTIRGD